SADYAERTATCQGTRSSRDDSAARTKTVVLVETRVGLLATGEIRCATHSEPTENRGTSSREEWKARKMIGSKGQRNAMARVRAGELPRVCDVGKRLAEVI